METNPNEEYLSPGEQRLRRATDALNRLGDAYQQLATTKSANTRDIQWTICHIQSELQELAKEGD
jgi:hypothetical protein